MSDYAALVRVHARAALAVVDSLIEDDKRRRDTVGARGRLDAVRAYLIDILAAASS